MTDDGNQYNYTYCIIYALKNRKKIDYTVHIVSIVNKNNVGIIRLFFKL